VAAAWVFGREFADRTARGLLALPVTRRSIVAAKLLVVAIWCAVLSSWVLGLGLLIGPLIGLPGFSSEAAWLGVSRFGAAAAMTVALQTTTAAAASAGRGYLAPLGWAMLTVFLAQVAAAAGFGAYFPWSVPALVSGIAGVQGETVGPASFLVVGATSALGLVGLFSWWERADQPA
jgi:ABC-2 type transport system permease protein